jgi:2-(1,2-epoxy-1,2-dihydrophenyl)acetyl-CoA isomerase
LPAWGWCLIWAACSFLARAVGINKAKELCFTARKVDAAEALALGIANKVVPHDDLMAEARAMAKTIAAGSPTAMAMTKRLLNFSQTATIEQMLEYETMPRRSPI